jgi:hypothetical protein
VHVPIPPAVAAKRRGDAEERPRGAVQATTVPETDHSPGDAPSRIDLSEE